MCNNKKKYCDCRYICYSTQKAALSAEGVTEESSDSISCKGPAVSTPKSAAPRDDIPLETKIRRLHGYEQKLSCRVSLLKSQNYHC